jgi:glycopeptide antibiotics resistance protein
MLSRMSQIQPSRPGLPWLAIWAVVAVIVVVALLVWPTAVDGSLVALVEAISSRFGTGPWSETMHVAQFLANVALFVPLALIVGMATRRWWLGLVVGIATSGGSELVQRALPGRDASVEDVIANSLGAAIGAVLALAMVRRQRVRKLDR